MSDKTLSFPENYDDFLRNLKEHIQSAQVKAALAALRNVNTPIGVSTHHLPEHLSKSLPSVEQLEMELETIVSEVIAQD